MNIFLQIYRQIESIFKKMSPMQRTNLILLTAISVVFSAIIVIWASRTDFVLLYSNLNTKDAGAIKSKLDEMKVENKVEGNSIFVPSKSVYETRLLLAKDGLPQESTVGYEIFGKGNFIMTDYLQQLNYKRALEGELARTIGSLKGITGCRVHLAIPKKGLFEEEAVHTSASVVLNIAQGAPLSKAQVGGIVHLVASSVEGLSPQYVNIIDGRGNLLYGQDESAEGGSGSNSSQFDSRQSVESYLEKKAESMLVTILGPGKALVRVNAAMDFDRVEKTEEKYDPEGSVPRTEVSNSESSKETGGAEGAAGKSSEKTQEKVTTNYEISRTISKIVNSVGKVKKLTVSVIVDGTYKAVESTEGGKKVTKKEYVARTKEEKEMYKKLVMNAVGFDSQRGDEIEINDASFDSSNIEQESKMISSAESKDFMFNLIKQVGIIVLFILAFLFLTTMLKSVTTATANVSGVAVPKHAKTVGVSFGGGTAGTASARQQSSSANSGFNATVGEDLEPVGVGGGEGMAVNSDIEATVGVVKDWLKE